MVWGWPSSKRSKLSFGEVGNQRAVLIFDVEEQLDDVDVDLEGSRLWSCWSLALALDEAAGAAERVGFARLRASDNDRATTKEPASRHELQYSLSMSVRIPWTLLVYPVNSRNG